ncbi:MAG: DUF11 domain-containing protein [Planctomycetaceae bacterium]|nr:DUF11 domain-containing protein [Planctomycetaceae bacterium]
MKKVITTMMCALMAVLIVACCTPPEPQPAPAPAPAPVAKPAPKPAPVPVSTVNRASQDYLCSGCGALRIEKVMPETVQLNQPFDYVINVTNLTGQTLSDILVRDRLPENYKYAGSSPEGTLEGRVVSWKLNTLGPNATEKIVVKGAATQVGTVQTCADATYIMLACAKTQVVQPALAIAKTAPANVLICDPIPLTFTVTNKGTGTATNVRLTDTLPDGLTTQDGKKVIDMPLGNMAPQQSISKTVVAKAAKTGTFKNEAFAAADGNLKAQSETTSTVVTQPVLAIEKVGRQSEYLGRQVSYDITVTNKGDAAANNTVVTDTLPAGITDIKATQGGIVAGNVVTWQVGALAPQAKKTVSVSYVPGNEGTFANTAKATAVCAEAVSASAQVAIKGIPAVLLEVIDVSDPIAVGQNETYIITVTNQGTAHDTNVRVTANLEDTMQFVSASGATNGTFEGGKVTFAPLATLAPKAKATWRVVVKAVKPADARFMVLMRTDQLGRDVGETEATNFYE